MAVTSCYYDGPPVVTLNERFLATYTQKYIVHTNSLMGPAKVVEGAYSLGGSGTNDAFPAFAATYNYLPGGVSVETDDYAYARNFQAVPKYDANSSRYLWTVTVVYTPLPEGKDPDDVNTDPTKRSVEFNTDWEVYTEVAEQDVDDKPIHNPCGREFDVQLELERSRSVIVCSFNVDGFGTAIKKCLKYQDSVNKETWDFGGLLTGTDRIKPRQALCRNISSSGILTEGENAYYRIMFRIALKEDTWDETLANRGFGFFEVANDNDTYTTEDPFGNPITEPVNLKEDGTIAFTKPPTSDDQTYSTFKIRKESDYTNIFSATVV